MLKGLQFASLLLIGSLFALTGLRQFFVHPLENSATNLIWFIVQVLPLLIVVPGLFALRPRGFLFAALISTLYFVHGVLLSVDPSDRVMGLSEAGFAIALLSLSVIAVKKANESGSLGSE